MSNPVCRQLRLNQGSYGIILWSAALKMKLSVQCAGGDPSMSI